MSQASTVGVGAGVGDRAAAVGWLEAATPASATELSSEFGLLVAAAFLCSADPAVAEAAAEAVATAAAANADDALTVASLLVYHLGRPTSTATAKHAIISKLPLLSAKHRVVVGPVLNLILQLFETPALRAIAITTLGRLWQLQVCTARSVVLGARGRCGGGAWLLRGGACSCSCSLADVVGWAPHPRLAARAAATGLPTAPGDDRVAIPRNRSVRRKLSQSGTCAVRSSGAAARRGS